MLSAGLSAQFLILIDHQDKRTKWRREGIRGLFVKPIHVPRLSQISEGHRNNVEYEDFAPELAPPRFNFSGAPKEFSAARRVDK